MRSWKLGVEEVSGLGVRRHPGSGSVELLAVSDREATVVGIRADASGGLPADEHGRRAAHHHEVHGLPGGRRKSGKGSQRKESQRKESQGRGSGGTDSQWEGIAGDVDGRVVVLRERSSELLVLSPGFHLERRIALRHEWEDDEQAGLESLLLLRRGHVLSAKQRRPLTLLEFGPAGDDPLGLTPSTMLPVGESAQHAAAPELRCLAQWEFPGDALRSANDMAVHAGSLYVISSVARGIARVRLPVPATRPLVVDGWWPLPDGIADGPDAKAEGLIVDGDLGILVGVDSHDDGDNLYQLDRVPDRR
jgi:hypothetical protein